MLITTGYYDPIPEYKRMDTLKMYPRYFMDVDMNEDVHKACARCRREIKPCYTYCYRCNSYLRVKARIASDG